MNKKVSAFTILFSLLAGSLSAADIEVIEKRTLGIDLEKDYKVRIFTLCINDYEFVHTFTSCPRRGSVDSHFLQIYEQGSDGSSIPKKCK